MEILITFFALVYLAFILLLCFGNFSLKSKVKYSAALPYLTVIVPFRNEEDNLSAVLNCLRNQTYPKERLEIIFVDDHSTDYGSAIIETEIKQIDCEIRLIHLKENQGKKQALILGIEQARGEVICTTDADCTMQENWLLSMVSTMEEKELQFCMGPVSMKSGSSLIGRALQLEFAALIAAGSGAAALGLPFICNGANLAFRKALFEKLDPYRSNMNTASGDDVFFLHEAVRSKVKIGFASYGEALVSTKAPSSLNAFIAQRIRWTKKSSKYKNGMAWFSGFVIISMNLLLIYLLLSASWNIFALVFTVKFLVDTLLVYSARKFLGLKSLLLPALFLSFFFPVYVLGIALLSLRYQPTWKGREI